MLHAEEQGNKI